MAVAVEALWVVIEAPNMARGRGQGQEDWKHVKALREVDVPEKDAPLRDDVRALGALVGAIITEQGGESLFERVEAARVAAIERREGDRQAEARLCSQVEGLPAEEAEELVRAFSTYFQVVNLAERVHRIRRGRDYLRRDVAQNHSLLDTVRQLADAGMDRADAHAVFQDVRAEPVFTAHPTEATRRIILEKQERVARSLVARFDPSRTPREERVTWARIREDVTAAWQTEEHPGQRPTVEDEREHVLYYVAGSLYRVAPVLQETLNEALDEVFGSDASPSSDPNDPSPSTLVRFASWVGGDMDGNPNVDATTLRATLERHREVVLDRYVQDAGTLGRHLSQSAGRARWSEAVDAKLQAYAESMPESVERVPARHRDMGYRVLLAHVQTRLRDTRDAGPHAYPSAAGFLDDVRTVADSLAAHGGRHAGLFGVRRLLRRIRTFGFHLAALDVRQDAREIRDVMAELLHDAEWSTRDPADRTERLHELIAECQEGGQSPHVPVDSRAGRLLDVFRAMREGRERFGPEALGAFVISMAQGVDDVLSVLYLARRAGLLEDGHVPLDVAPLLETVPDLASARTTVAQVFADPVVSAHLERRDNRCMVMVGYSDSNKDGGILAARWALHGALSAMAEAADEAGIRLTVFHGRGGTASRGGGNVDRAVAAMPSAAVSGRLRLTEQGEVIDAKYGLPAIALRSLERMVGALAKKAAGVTRLEPVPADWVEGANTAAAAARTQYRALVYEDARFTPYFRSATPIDVIERMSIGSRPASRRAGQGVQDLRAIPWVFSWTQCRAMLTGWYGLGSGLAAAARAIGESEWIRAARSWPFLQALLADVEMVLAKADLDIARRYRALAPDASHGVFDQIVGEFDRTAEWVTKLTGHAELLGGEPTLQRSIRLRNPYVDPMSMLQVDLLARWRAADRQDVELERALLATVNGIARGLQNTG